MLFRSTLAEHIDAIDQEEGLAFTVETVGEHLAQALQLPFGERPDHVFVDGQAKGADAIAKHVGEAQARFVARLGFGDLLARDRPASG